MLSFSNFGSTRHPLSEKVRRATELVKQRDPLLMIDGEMMADTAVAPEILEREYGFSSLRGAANVLIFPDLQSANIAYKLLIRVGGAEAIGPLLLGMSKPVYVLSRGTDVEDIVNSATIAVLEAQGSTRKVEAKQPEDAPVAVD
jgi:malate dehydrogenase (oxaloacetate-decarboxylating)(NADP+)